MAPYNDIDEQCTRKVKPKKIFDKKFNFLKISPPHKWDSDDVDERVALFLNKLRTNKLSLTSKKENKKEIVTETKIPAKKKENIRNEVIDIKYMEWAIEFGMLFTFIGLSANEIKKDNDKHKSRFSLLEIE